MSGIGRSGSICLRFGQILAVGMWIGFLARNSRFWKFCRPVKGFAHVLGGYWRRMSEI
jgi:hypothetical protein